jgi:hypothetical protein
MPKPQGTHVVGAQVLGKILKTCLTFTQVELSPHFTPIALMMEAVRTSETIVNLYQSTQDCNAPDSHHPLARYFADVIPQLTSVLVQCLRRGVWRLTPM